MMLYKIFNVTMFNAASEEDALNTFIRNHKIIEMEKAFYSGAGGSCWSFCLSYLDDSGMAKSFTDTKKSKVDYKQVLAPEDFEKFARLREIRKIIASEDGLPPYAVFTNDELAQLAQQPEISKSAMLKIPGVGEKKAEKYEEKFRLMYEEMMKPTI